MRNPKSEFVKVKCEKCKNEQILFNKPAIEVKCLVCDSTVAKPTGGKGDIKAKVIQKMD
ncbi:30S ribosomal protein S27e [archaeon]|nr:30S ribosomal protein S27e [archaeon]|tara:strand:+ start:2333 stop:2509 length:177 start_codon:yes stop_codon:yes gene_type:complete